MSGVEARDQKSQPQGKKILHKQEQGQELGKDGDHIVCVCFNLIDFDKKWFEYHSKNLDCFSCVLSAYYHFII